MHRHDASSIENSFRPYCFCSSSGRGSVKAQVCTLIPNGGGQGFGDDYDSSTGASLPMAHDRPARRFVSTRSQLLRKLLTGGARLPLEAERTINHINVQSVFLRLVLNGHYVAGTVRGCVLPRAGYSLFQFDRPLYTTLFAPGTYNITLGSNQHNYMR